MPRFDGHADPGEDFEPGPDVHGSTVDIDADGFHGYEHAGQHAGQHSHASRYGDACVCDCDASHGWWRRQLRF